MSYTHWAYFPDQATAEACSRDFTTTLDCLAAVDPPTEGDTAWLLRVVRSFPLDELQERHDEARLIVEKHGGEYDFGETTSIFPTDNPYA